MSRFSDSRVHLESYGSSEDDVDAGGSVGVPHTPPPARRVRFESTPGGQNIKPHVHEVVPVKRGREAAAFLEEALQHKLVNIGGKEYSAMRGIMFYHYPTDCAICKRNKPNNTEYTMHATRRTHTRGLELLKKMNKSVICNDCIEEILQTEDAVPGEGAGGAAGGAAKRPKTGGNKVFIF